MCVRPLSHAQTALAVTHQTELTRREEELVRVVHVSCHASLRSLSHGLLMSCAFGKLPGDTGQSAAHRATVAEREAEFARRQEELVRVACRIARMACTQPSLQRGSRSYRACLLSSLVECVTQACVCLS